MRLNASTLSLNLYRNKPSILLCHVPKTGGSSVASAIRRHYLFSHFNIRSEASTLASLAQYGLDADDPASENACQTLRSSLVFYAAAQGMKFITGHLWRPARIATLRTMGYQTMTLLRDPVERWYSLFFYGRYKEGQYARIDMEIEDFLASDRGLNAGRVYVRYLGGIRGDNDYNSAEAFEQARRGLDDFDMVGFLDDLPGFSQRFEARHGLKLRIPHKRKSPARKGEDPSASMRRYKESAEIRARVTALCAPDIELYEYARQRFA